MSLEYVKQEVEREAECVEALWEALYRDIALQDTQGLVPVAGPQPKIEAAQDSEYVPFTQFRLGHSSAKKTARTETTDLRNVSSTHSCLEDPNTSKTPKTEIAEDLEDASTCLEHSRTEAECDVRDIPGTIPRPEDLDATQRPKAEFGLDPKDISSTLNTLEATRGPGDLNMKLVETIANNTANTQIAQDCGNNSSTNSSNITANSYSSASDTPNRAIYDPGLPSNNLKESSISKTAETEPERHQGEGSVSHKAQTERANSPIDLPPSLGDSSTSKSLKKVRPIPIQPCSVKLERKILKSGFLCQICNRTCSYRHNLINHMLSHTQAEIATVKLEKKIIKKGKIDCHICGKGLAHKKSLYKHLRLGNCDPFREQMHRKLSNSRTKTYYTCDICGLSTIRKTSLMRHMKRHARQKPLVCQVCNRHFKAAWELFDHMKLAACKPREALQSNTKPCTVINILEGIALKPCYVSLERIKRENIDNTVMIKEASSFNGSEDEKFDEDDVFETGEETYYCGVCEEQFETLSSLDDHVCRPMKLSCYICKKRFKHQCSLNDHSRIHTGEKPFSCNDCKKQFRLKSTLKTHILTMHGSWCSYSCKFCKEKFRSNFSLKKHVRTHTGQKEKKPYSCKICKKKFRFSVACVEHERVHTGDKPFKCEICPKAFRLASYLRIHSRSHSGDKPYTCEYCKKSFRVWQLWNLHKRVHTNERPFKCEVCSKQFKRPDTLRTHRRTHTGDKPYVCEFCSKRFTQVSHLNSHRRVHTGEKPFSCTVCGQRFAEPHHLKLHSLLHSGERPHSCSICQKAFKDARTLKIHNRSHTGEKAYECNICKKQCSQSSNLRTHMKIHGKKTWPFGCHICEKRFQKRRYLAQHLARHGGRRAPLMCDVCGASFSSGEVLSAHCLSHYGGE